MNREHWNDLLKNAETSHGFAEGFKLLYCPWSVLGGSEMTFLSLNPGSLLPNNTEIRCVSDERGNSYEVERYTTRSPITEQFLRMCDFTGIKPNEVLTGVAAPFRSANWNAQSRDQREANEAIGQNFWGEALHNKNRHGPVVVCSEPAMKLVATVTSAKLEATLPAGWGSISIRRYRADNGASIIQLPHLSRFRLFGRPESEFYLKQAFELD
jgi:hypothetical protein